ncbi:MAG: hypothetical protein HY835_14805 [Anaerolineae bacterium]|nr:hypothetical protein [Anaerolineae bacterium]
MESTESSSPLVVRAVAAGLSGRAYSTFNLPGWQKTALKVLGGLPQETSRRILMKFQAMSALDPEKLASITTASLTQIRLDDYKDVKGPFPMIVTGAALGGAAAYLSLAVDGPFLPSAFVFTLKGGSPLGDLETYVNRSAKLVDGILERNPDLLSIQHYDPVHDGWLTRWANHVRLKLLKLPETYQDYIRKNLAPGGTIFLLNCGAKWLRLRRDLRSIIQVGGWGGISSQRFLEPDDDMVRVARKEGFTRFDWTMNGFPVEEGPESEWGVEAAYAKAVRAFCKANGYELVEASFTDPEDYARLAWRSAQLLLQKEDRQPAGVLVETFTQFDAISAMRTGLLPLWLVFNTTESLSFLQEMVRHFPKAKPVFFSPLITFSRTPDLVPFRDWQLALVRYPMTVIGARSKHYPFDVAQLAEWNKPLQRWADNNDAPIRARLVGDDFLHLIEDVKVGKNP